MFDILGVIGGVAVTLIEGVAVATGLADTEGDGEGVGTTDSRKKNPQYNLYQH